MSKVVKVKGGTALECFSGAPQDSKAALHCTQFFGAARRMSIRICVRCRH